MVIGCLPLSDVSVICGVVTVRRTSQKIWGGFLYGVYYELIPTVEMKTRNPIEGYSGNEFRVICNNCGVMAAWSRKTLKFLSFFCRKNDPYGKIFKILFQMFSSRHWSTCCVQVSVKFGRREIIKIVHWLPDKKLLPGSPAVATACIAPKICQGQQLTM